MPTCSECREWRGRCSAHHITRIAADEACEDFEANNFTGRAPEFESMGSPSRPPLQTVGEVQ
jgi:hypothetical protein